MHIAQTAGSRLETGSMAELNLRILLGCLDHIGLMSKAVGKYDLASLVCQVHGCILGCLILWNVPLNNDLIVRQAQCLLHLHGAGIVGSCISLVLIAYVDKTNLQIFLGHTARRRWFRGLCLSPAC